VPYAIIRTGGKQYRVAQGDRLRIEKIPAQVGDQVRLGEVLAWGEGAGLVVGEGPIADAAVTARVVRHGRGRKIRIWKFKRRLGYEKRIGHRQDYTEIQVLSIGGAEG
jgi:large subunit ribosomal protein L21